MCGIVGFNWKDEKLVREMASVLKHRGPDDKGSYSSKSISVGHRRLSILDLTEAGHQPLFYSKETGTFSEKFNKEDYNKFLRGRIKDNVGIVYNGEVYNFKELKQELASKGYVFNTKTDSEVILACYLEYGFDCVNKFNGMWSFCIVDFKKNILFCSRDRLGQKPFYYYHADGKFIFASELKSILKHEDLELNKVENINKEAVDLYFSMGFIPSPYSIYKDVFKLEASHNLIFELGSKTIKKWQYYEIPDYNPINNKKWLIKEGRRILKDAVRLRMISDVPVGAFLSGGLDSSVIVGAMKDFTDLNNLNTFSIGFEGEFDETKYMEIVRNYYKTKHHHDYFNENDFQSMIEHYSDIYDEPFGDYSGFPTYKVSAMARQEVTVSLSGDGGDEVFGGYNAHILGKRIDFIRKFPKWMRVLGSKIPAKKNLDGFRSLFLLKDGFRISLDSKEEIYASSLKGFSLKPEVYKRWTREKMIYCLKKGKGKLAESLRIFDLLYNTLADNFLVKVDRASMANSLEVRSPFLDYRFIEFSQRIPTKWKTSLFKTKILMREIIKDIVPRIIVKRGKQGFTPPLERWILDKRYESDLKRSLRYLGDINPGLSDFFVQKVLREDNDQYNVYKIRLFLFGEWFEKWCM